MCLQHVVMVSLSLSKITTPLHLHHSVIIIAIETLPWQTSQITDHTESFIKQQQSVEFDVEGAGASKVPTACFAG